MKNLPNVLIVDDSEENIFFLESVIKKIKVNLIKAFSGLEALEKSKDLELALAIIDVRMPEMNGYELAMRLNEIRQENKVPIIFLTASHVTEVQVFKGYGYGAVDYLVKPVNNNILLCKINVFLDLSMQKQTIARDAALLKKSADELIKANEALVKSEKKYRSYIDNAPDGVFVTDEKGKYIEVNEAACAITGYSKDELLNMSVSDILPDESVEDGLAHFRADGTIGKSKADLLFKHKNRKTRWWAVEAVKLSETRYLGFTKDITLRIEMEEAIRRHQFELESQNDELSIAIVEAKVASEKYAELYNFAPSGYFTLSTDYKILDLNLGGAHLLGKERSRIIDSHFGLFVSIDTLPVFHAFLLDVFKKDSKEFCEVMLETGGIQRKWVHMEGVTIGNGAQCLLNVVDITDRKNAEERLKQTSTRLALATRAGGVGVWELDFFNNKMTWDDRMFELYGIDEKDFTRNIEAWYACIHPDDLIRCNAEIEMAKCGEKEFDTEFRVCHTNGSVHNIRAMAIILHDSSGSPQKAIGTNWDITKQKQLEDKLKSSEVNFRTFFETMGDMIMVGNSQGEVFYVNTSLCHKLGYKTEDFQRMNLLEMIQAERRIEAEQIFIEMSTGKRNSCNLPLVRKDGSLVPVEIRVWYGKWDGKDCIFGIAKDLTSEQEALLKFNKIFYGNPALMAMSTFPEAVFTDVNDAYITKTGYTREELIGKISGDLNLSLQPEKQKIAFKELEKKGFIHNLELTIKTKSGATLDGLFSGEIVENQGKKFFLSVMVDITARKKAEEALRKSESNLAEAQRIAHMGSWEWDMISGTVIWSEEMYRLFDMERKNKVIKPESIIKNLHPDDVGIFSESMKSNLSDGKSTSLEYRVVHKDGSIHHLFAEGRVEFDDDGKPIRSIGTVQDITERKIAEQQMKIGEEKYKTMLNASPDGILLVDMNGIVTEASEIGLELLGAESRNDLVSKDIFRFIPSDEKYTLKEIINRTMNEGLAQNVGMQIRKRNRTLFAGETSVTLIQNPDGTPSSFMIIIRDISQRKKMETKQMHADRMANLGEMASGIAHEINQPLNIISMVMDKILFESVKADSIDLEFLKNKSNKIFDNITRIRNIIDHIRAFSRSHDDFVLTAFDINASIESATSMISEQFKHLGISLLIQLDNKIPSICGNTYKFEQVIINLLVNAKDAVLEKKGKQDADFEMVVGIKSYKENQILVVEVTDNGIGIGNEDINNVILPFYTTKDEGKGTGLGLSICYQIIKEMGGNIEIISDYSHGTTIKLLLDITEKK